MSVPLYVIQASNYGLHDYSVDAYDVPHDINRISVIDQKYFYDFGGDTHVRWPTNDYLDISTKKITIEGWVYTEDSAPATSQYFLSGLKEGSYVDGFYIGFRETGFCFPTGNGTRQYTAFLDAPENEVMHFAWVMDGTTKTLYINGMKIGTDPAQEVFRSESIVFGSLDNKVSDLYPSHAKISQLIIWNSAIYTEEFTPEYKVYTRTEMAQIHSYNSIIYDRRVEKNININNNGIISDKVTIDDVPVSCKICLHTRQTGMLVDTVWSKDDGSYIFSGLNMNSEYYIVAIDHNRKYNAVIQDMIKPKLKI